LLTEDLLSASEDLEVLLGLYYYTLSIGKSTSKFSGVRDLDGEGDFYPVFGASSE
jgi:hypothetical protein